MSCIRVRCCRERWPVNEYLVAGLERGGLGELLHHRSWRRSCAGYHSSWAGVNHWSWLHGIHCLARRSCYRQDSLYWALILSTAAWKWQTKTMRFFNKLKKRLLTTYCSFPKEISTLKNWTIYGWRHCLIPLATLSTVNLAYQNLYLLFLLPLTC